MAKHTQHAERRPAMLSLVSAGAVPVHGQSSRGWLAGCPLLLTNQASASRAMAAGTCREQNSKQAKWTNPVSADDMLVRWPP